MLRRLIPGSFLVLPAFLLASAASARAQALLRAIDGAAPDDAFGSSVAGLGDVNADGREDFLVGATQGIAGAGYAQVLSGPGAVLLHAFGGAAALDGFGFSGASAGDADGDGLADILVGAPYEDRGGLDAGAVHLYSGGTGAEIRGHGGAAASEQLGWSVAGLGDLDGDGRSDYAAGAIQGGAANGGSVRVYSGGSGALLRMLHGAAAFDAFGAAVAGPGDLNGDLVPDILVGAPFADHGGPDSGSVYLYSGSTGARCCASTASPPGSCSA